MVGNLKKKSSIFARYIKIRITEVIFPELLWIKRVKQELFVAFVNNVVLHLVNNVVLPTVNNVVLHLGNNVVLHSVNNMVLPTVDKFCTL